MLVACSFVCFGLIFSGVFQFMKNPDCPLLLTVGLSYLYSDMRASPIHWMKTHRGLSAKKCDCGDWTCGLAICVGWEMNKSLIYEVRHYLLSVLAQLSSLSHPINELPCDLGTWVPYQVLQKFHFTSFGILQLGSWARDVCDCKAIT